MADPPSYPSYPETDDDPGVGPDRAPSTRRLVSVVGICIAVVVVLVIVVLHPTGTLGRGAH
jgi:hypothetical protein